MKVLLLGATGNVGSRLLPALIAHNHRVVVYVRSPSKLSAEASSKADAVVAGSGTDSVAIKDTILTHNCDAVVNAAGFPASMAWNKSDFPDIFAAIVKAAVEVKKERGGLPLRIWFLSGLGLLDAPKKPYKMLDYLPIFLEHRTNYNLIKTNSDQDIAWSLFCPGPMTPKNDPPKFLAPTEVALNNLVVMADSPPAWQDSFLWLPLIGGLLNIIANAMRYTAMLEDCADFMAADLEKGLHSEWIGKRVGVIEKAKAA